jgi:plastocyanin
VHNFSVEGQPIDVTLAPASPATVTVTFPRSGTIGFRCKLHLQQNMRGELVSH